MKEVVVFLSPHLDDAVLSCAGRIYTEAQAGRRVIVVTVFSRGGNDEGSRDAYERRRAEDRAAMEILGAEPIWLDLPDAPFRRNYYRCFREIVFDTHPDDTGYSGHVAQRVQALCCEVKPVRLYAPLGVGAHIDHRLTHAAAGCQGGLRDIRYYEDRPYAMVRHAVRMRLIQLGLPVVDMSELETMPQELLAESFLSSFDRAHWTHSYLPSGPEREFCRSKLAERFRDGKPESGRQYHAEVDRFGPDVFSCVLAAVTAYASQFRDLFAGREDFISQSEDYSDLLGAGRMYAERYWRAEDSSRRPSGGGTNTEFNGNP